MAGWRDGRLKQGILHRALSLRGKLPVLFGKGSYLPLKVEGPGADHVVAFARQFDDRTVITIVSRLPATTGIQTMPVIPAEFWQDTRILLPRSLHGRTIMDVLGSVGASDNVSPLHGAAELKAAACLAVLPVALLEV
jgi:(1->4)-alpha-D-glucan 1-alpha-D-glucosylmutase